LRKIRPDFKREADMADVAPLPPFEAIVVAAGKGLRVGGQIPKQFRVWRGKPLVRHSVETLIIHGANKVVVAIPAGGLKMAEEALSGLNVTFVIGGETRQQSVRNALEALSSGLPSRVLIHDAARPDLPRAVMVRLLAALQSDAIGAIPVLPVVDSMVFAEDDRMGSSPDRDALRRVQTPQAFRFDDILAAHRDWAGEPNAGDDAQVLVAQGQAVELVVGDERLKKITFAEDLVEGSTNVPMFRVGQGYDVHRLVKGEELWLCGIKIDHDKGLAGHSDADVALHAITDAVLGAIGDGDIGSHFPPTDSKWAGARSGQFLQHAVKLAGEAGYAIGNIDLTLICEAPKIGPHRPAMRAEVARLTGLGEGAVSIKATTTEKLGFTGRGEGIAAQAIVSLWRS
jgi:2-C-methyl-D-erythritol 4-phosphate cytidylyltransferase/2-C-methyl-D-erythritol 2,4-cyclodiphosphate synthase